MAQTVKTPYIMIVRRHIVKLVLKTKVNLRRGLSPALDLPHVDEDLINEEEQNRFNEELERSLAVV